MNARFGCCNKRWGPPTKGVTWAGRGSTARAAGAADELATHAQEVATLQQLWDHIDHMHMCTCRQTT